MNPCCNQDLPNVSLLIFPHVPGPLPRLPLRCLRSFLPPRALAFPSELQGRRIAKSQQLFQLGVGFRGCSHLLMFRPASLLAPQIAPTLASRQSFPIDAGQPGTFTSAPITVGCLLRAADTLAVQIRAIDGKGTYTPLDQQPCWLLQFAITCESHRRRTLASRRRTRPALQTKTLPSIAKESLSKRVTAH